MGGCGRAQAGDRQQAAGSCTVRSCLTPCQEFMFCCSCVTCNESSAQELWSLCSLTIACLLMLASSLLGSVTSCRCNFLAGYVVPRHELAFSQPTEQGRSFAAAYTGSQKLLVYQ